MVKQTKSSELSKTEEEYEVPTSIDDFLPPSDTALLQAVDIINRTDRDGNVILQSDKKPQKVIVLQWVFGWNTAPNARSETTPQKLNIPEKRTTDSLLHRWLKALKDNCHISKFDSWQDLVGKTFELAKTDVEFGKFTYENFRYPVGIIEEVSEE